MKALLAALLVPLAAAAAAPAAQPAPALPAPRVEAYFTPGDDIAARIAERIGAARQTVHVQAYLFTHRKLAAALVRAARRGVAVEVVGDAKQHAAGGLPVVAELARAGVGVWLNDEFAAFHHKVVLVDARTTRAVVITGSFNFTPSAQSRNAENAVVITGDPASAGAFLRDFERHRGRASRLQ